MVGVQALGDGIANAAVHRCEGPIAIAWPAVVISRFDVVVQDFRRNTAALKRLWPSSAPGWQVIVFDVTEGGAGNGERLAFLYDSTPYTASFTRGRVEFTLASGKSSWQEPCRAAPGNHRGRQMDA